MDVNGQAAPYIQYAFVRANSIVKKFGDTLPSVLIPKYELTEAEVEMIDLLARFPQEIQRAAKDLRPLLIANYSYDLAKAFSNFYTKCPVLSAEDHIRDFRLRIVDAFKQVVENSLEVLGIEVPEVM